MVRFHTNDTTYPHPFPLVSLAYFLRYPNPYSTHVLSADTISRSFDPQTNRLTTVRLVLKQKKLSSTIMSLLPKGILNGGGRGADGAAQNFVLETSVVDIKEGWMETESRNLQYTGVLSVIEKQRFSRPAGVAQDWSGPLNLYEATKGEHTDASTSVTLISRFSWSNYKNAQPATQIDETAPKKGFFSTWSASALQRTIEMNGLQRTRKAMVKSKEGMLVVLERVRQGGLDMAMAGMKKDEGLVEGVSEFRQKGFQSVWAKDEKGDEGNQ